jgi:ATP-dependent DNA helicase DinG
MHQGSNISAIFDADGPLAKSLNGYQPRASQIEMAVAVDQSITEQSTLVVEAGTGTGKTFAYLVPAILSDKKVIVSTGTKNLQDQLYWRDLPFLLGALNTPIKTALLKGRANYLCHLRLERTLAEGLFHDRDQVTKLQVIKRWSTKTRQGDKSELDDVAENDTIWGYVTSTADNCSGQDCPYYDDCYVLKARQQAMDADLVVVNHHLFFADLALKDDGFGELLPESEAIIMDEAHQIPEIASLFFGRSLSLRQLTDFCHDLQTEVVEQGNDLSDLIELKDTLQKSALDLRLSLPEEGVKKPYYYLDKNEIFQQCFTQLSSNLEQCKEALTDVKDRSKELSQLLGRCEEFLALLGELSSVSLAEHVVWYETTKRSFTLHITPLAIDEQFRRLKSWLPESWVFTSATLTVGGQFEHFSQALGLESPSTQLSASPFDYQQQGLLYLPRYMPEPRSPDFLTSLFEHGKQVIEATRGRCFFLFTSYRSLNAAAEYYREALDYPILVQGEQSKLKLLDAFAKAGNAVLLATSSFWEGVDVRGEALSCVIIEKLPFSAPDEPVLSARIDAASRSGKNAFEQIQIPKAVITLKQGAGRLIRDGTDRGVLAIFDPRLISRPYGANFMLSLPGFKRTRNIESVQEFFHGKHTGA